MWSCHSKTADYLIRHKQVRQAQEILSDPAQRQIYDARRQRHAGVGINQNRTAQNAGEAPVMNPATNVFGEKVRTRWNAFHDRGEGEQRPQASRHPKGSGRRIPVNLTEEQRESLKKRRLSQKRARVEDEASAEAEKEARTKAREDIRAMAEELARITAEYEARARAEASILAEGWRQYTQAYIRGRQFVGETQTPAATFFAGFQQPGLHHDHAKAWNQHAQAHPQCPTFNGETDPTGPAPVDGEDEDEDVEVLEGSEADWLEANQKADRDQKGENLGE